MAKLLSRDQAAELRAGLEELASGLALAGNELATLRPLQMGPAALRQVGRARAALADLRHHLERASVSVPLADL